MTRPALATLCAALVAVLAPGWLPFTGVEPAWPQDRAGTAQAARERALPPTTLPRAAVGPGGPSPVGAAGPAPMGAGGPPPMGAGGPPPVRAAGSPPIDDTDGIPPDPERIPPNGLQQDDRDAEDGPTFGDGDSVDDELDADDSDFDREGDETGDGD